MKTKRPKAKKVDIVCRGCNKSYNIYTTQAPQTFIPNDPPGYLCEACLCQLHYGDGKPVSNIRLYAFQEFDCDQGIVLGVHWDKSFCADGIGECGGWIVSNSKTQLQNLKRYKK